MHMITGITASKLMVLIHCPEARASLASLLIDTGIYVLLEVD